MSDRVSKTLPDVARPDPARLIRAARAQTAVRVSSFALDGQVFWVKRPENLPLRARLQKGNSQSGFGRE